MKIKLLILSILQYVILYCNAQDIEFTKKNFTDKNGYEEATTNIRKGDDYFTKQKRWLYSQALEYYQKANNFNPNNSTLNFKIGVCLLNSSDKAEALSYFLKAQNLKPNVDIKIEFAIAQSYQYSLMFDSAIVHYNLFKQTYNEADKSTILKQIDKRISECENGKILVQNPIKINIENVSNINSKYSDYAPLITSDEKLMIFTSRREGSTGGEIDPNELEYYEDIYQTSKTDNGWSTPEKIKGNVNTSSHDASVGLSFDGQLLFIYRGLINGGDLYEYTFQNNEWQQPKQLNKINTEFHETSACITDDKNTLYIVSDRQDKTFGMRDIFVSHLLENGEWSEPENLGESINTPYDEEGVSVSKDGNTLYFSSTGHNTMGGFDLFKSVKKDDKWTTPENLGYPLNSPDNEMYCQVFETDNNLHGYFSSTRKDGVGSIDIYSFTIPKEETALKSSKDTTDNPDNYKLPINNNEPSNIFANVTDSTKTEKIINTTETQNTDKNKVQLNENNNINFKVQVGACHRQIPYAELHKRYPGTKKVTMEQHENWYKYLIGDYSKYSDAKQEKMSCGTPDAWVVVYKNNARINISEVINLLSFYPCNYYLLKMLI